MNGQYETGVERKAGSQQSPKPGRIEEVDQKYRPHLSGKREDMVKEEDSGWIQRPPADRHIVHGFIVIASPFEILTTRLCF
jgi:hypothetical protein